MGERVQIAITTINDKYRRHLCDYFSVYQVQSLKYTANTDGVNMVSFK